MLAPWVTLSLAAERDDVDEARGWRTEKMAELDRRLERSGADDPMNDEWLARRDWLRRWEPGKMPSAPDEASAPNRSAGDAVEKRPLVDEPDLSQTASAADQLGPTPREQLERANRLQRRLWRLDTLEDRKDNLIETADVALQLDQTLERLIGQLDSGPSEVREDLRWALAYARYRRARAIAYRELPDVLESLPIDDAEAYEQQLAAARDRLQRTFAQPRAEFVLFEIRMLRRADWRGQALRRLEQFAWAIEAKWYLKKRRDLLDELGWGPPHREAAELYAASGLDDH